MALTEETVCDKFEVVHADTIPVIQCRHATIIKKDGVEVARTFHRHVLTPDYDVSNESAQIQALAAALFTDEVKAAYAAQQASE